MLEVRDLSKTYSNGVHALKNVSLEIPNGMFGLLGPNGAGKSTLMRTIATLQDPDRGTITLDGIDVLANNPKRAARSAICRRTSASIRRSPPRRCSTTWRC